MRSVIWMKCVMNRHVGATTTTTIGPTWHWTARRLRATLPDTKKRFDLLSPPVGAAPLLPASADRLNQSPINLTVSTYECAKDREDYKYITPVGGNMLNDQHPSQGTLFQNYDKQDVERRFAAMQGLDLNCLRQAIGVNEVFDPTTCLRADGMHHWGHSIQTAEKYGVYLMPVGGYIGGNDWFDVAILADSGKALDESCRFGNSL